MMVVEDVDGAAYDESRFKAFKYDTYDCDMATIAVVLRDGTSVTCASRKKC